MTTTSNQPYYLVGATAPVPDEIDAYDLAVTGALPTELQGRYFRNGANPLPGADPGHWFTGLGMLHGVYLAEGRAQWYRNRWVRTPALDGIPIDRLHPFAPAGTMRNNSSNTSVIHHSGRILSLVENGLPHRLTAELDTVGSYDFNGRLTTAMTAHPKIDPVTGELHFFGYGIRPPFVTYHVVSPAGELVRSTEISVPGPTMMHDFAITEHYVLWLDLPVVFDMDLVRKPGMPYRWSDDYAPRIGVMPRNGGDEDIRWIDVAPGYAFHVSNAYEDELGQVVLESIYYDDVAFDTGWATLGGQSTLSEALARHSTSNGNLYRWKLDPVHGTVSESPLDDLPVEFPTINAERVGYDSRFVYAISTSRPTDEERSPSIVKYDTRKGTRDSFFLDEGWAPGEAEFVASPTGDGEDSGWLLSIVTHETADAAQLLVLDATDLAAGPVATVHLPRRVPLGFHGTWIADSVAS